MILCYRLIPPEIHPTTGHLVDEDRQYLVVRDHHRDGTIARATEILAKSPFSFESDQGWKARIIVTEIDRCEAWKLRRSSSGFCGCHWMINSIWEHGAIVARIEPTGVQE